jgi:hypothetical protein
MRASSIPLLPWLTLDSARPFQSRRRAQRFRAGASAQRGAARWPSTNSAGSDQRCLSVASWASAAAPAAPLSHLMTRNSRPGPARPVVSCGQNYRPAPLPQPSSPFVANSVFPSPQETLLPGWKFKTTRDAGLATCTRPAAEPLHDVMRRAGTAVQSDAVNAGVGRPSQLSLVVDCSAVSLAAGTDGRRSSAAASDFALRGLEEAFNGGTSGLDRG